MSEYIVDTIALKKLMIEKGYNSNTAFATALGFDRNVVGSVVSGKKRPSVGLMDRMVSVLGMDAKTAGAVFFAANLRGT